MIELVNNNLDKVQFETKPFNHWVYDKVLPENIANDLSDLPILSSSIDKNSGKRDTYNTSRLFFNKRNCNKYSLFRDIVNIFNNLKTIIKLSQIYTPDEHYNSPEYNTMFNDSKKLLEKLTNKKI
mgnify:CR=1 FL=1